MLRNVPQDGGCAQYHVIGAVEQNSKGQYVLTTDNGGLLISAGEGTGTSCYDGSPLALSDLKAGDRILAWYDVVLTSYPGQTLRHPRDAPEPAPAGRRHPADPEAER